MDLIVSGFFLLFISDLFLGFEEIDGDDDVREEYPCPFCSEYYDIVGLCCHIDEEHPSEAKNGVIAKALFFQLLLYHSRLSVIRVLY